MPSPAKVEAGRDRRLLVGGDEQLRLPHEQRQGQDAGGDRQSVDAGIEHAEAARRPDPFLARMPFAHVLQPARSAAWRSLAPASAAAALGHARRHAASASRHRACARTAAPRRSRCSISPRVAAGGFSSRTCSPASSASRAMAWRTLGGVQIATASSCPRIAAKSCCGSAWQGRPRPGSPLRVEIATSSNRGSAAIAGTCWSRAILPKPMMAMRIGISSLPGRADDEGAALRERPRPAPWPGLVERAAKAEPVRAGGEIGGHPVRA